MNNLISYGKANGVIILVGEKLGYNIQFKEQAVMLSQDSTIEPSYMGLLESEASRVHNLIARDGKVKQANKYALEMLK